MTQKLEQSNGIEEKRKTKKNMENRIATQKRDQQR